MLDYHLMVFADLSEDIHDSLSKKVTSIDISSVAISIMMERTRSKKSMKWEEGDLEKLDIGPSTFDVVVDKGTYTWAFTP